MLPLPAKQNLFNQFGGGVVHMGCATLVPLTEIVLPKSLTTSGAFSIGVDLSTLGPTVPISGAWGAANKAILFPFAFSVKFIVRAINWAAGGVSAGNYDSGIYDQNFALLRSVGSKAFPAINTFVEDAITPLSLQPGNYWLALALDDATAQVFGTNPTTFIEFRVVNVRGASASFPLPLTITPTTTPPAMIPRMAMASELV